MSHMARRKNYDDEDVQAILERETADGPGDLDALPESDWVSYATDEVEKKESDK